MISLPEASLAGKEEGEEMEVTVKGVLVEYNGKLCLEAREVDGQPVEGGSDELQGIEDDLSKKLAEREGKQMAYQEDDEED